MAGIAASGVEQDAVSGEEPVAITGAADPLHDLGVGERELQAGAGDGRALAGPVFDFFFGEGHGQFAFPVGVSEAGKEAGGTKTGKEAGGTKTSKEIGPQKVV